MASEKQTAFAEKLLAEREVSEANVNAVRDTLAYGTMREASDLIDWLITLPRKPLAHDDGDAISEGYFLQGDVVYRVQRSREGHLYAKRFVIDENGRAAYEYAPGALRHLAHAPRLTVEQAGEMGVRFGSCVVCAKRLTDPTSVQLGIGPVCRSRLS